MRRSWVTGYGMYLPERILTNEDLAKIVDTTDDWIRQRTGIEQRHIAAENEVTSDLAVNAARLALDRAALNPDDIDLVLVATTTPDLTFPATAVRVQSKLGMTKGFAFDVQAVCSGFIYGLSVADSMIRVGQVSRVLVIGAETFSRLLDWDDRTTCVLFGDGAGAVVLESGEGAGDSSDRGILSTHLHSDGRGCELLYTDGGVSSTGTVGHVRMNGREVFRHAVDYLASVLDEALEANGLSQKDIDWLVPHQANKRIIDSTAKKLGLSADRVVMTVQRHGNTSAASIPMALCEALDDGRIQPGHLVMLEAMGGGLTWGSALVRW